MDKVVLGNWVWVWALGFIRELRGDLVQGRRLGEIGDCERWFVGVAFVLLREMVSEFRIFGEKMEIFVSATRASPL
jgi:hypothetical protein